MKLARKSQEQRCSKWPKRTPISHQISRTKKKSKYFLCLFPLCLPALSLIGFFFQMKLPKSLDLVVVEHAPSEAMGTATTMVSSEFEERFRVHCQEGLFDDTEDKNTFKFAKTRTKPSYIMSIYPPAQDIWVSRFIDERGCWECESLKLVKAALEKYEDSYLLDIGGNIGQFNTFVSLALGKDAYALEPLKKNYDHTCRTVMKNDLHKHKLHLYKVALSKARGKVTLHVIDRNMGGTQSKFLDGGEHTTSSSSPVEGVDYAHAITLDSFYDQVLPKDRPVVMKVDIEGHELDALGGGLVFLEQANIVFCFIELLDKTWIEQPMLAGRIVEMMTKKGLVPMVMKNGLIPLQGPWESWFQTNAVNNMLEMYWIKGEFSN
jgi:FkbM family methyltransferase